MPLKYVDAPIANGQALSDVVGFGEDFVPVAIIMPAAWTAADITFQAADASGAFKNVYTAANAEVAVNVGVDRYIPLTPANFQGTSRIKIRSGTSGVPVNQGAAPHDCGRVP
jgi:hypothetical protein